MQRLTFRARISLWFALILFFSLLATGIVFAVSYFAVSFVNLENFMLREAREITEKHLTTVNGEIFFKRDEGGKTLSAYLRDENLAAMIIDNKADLVGAYGIYQGLLEKQKLTELVATTELDKVRITQKANFFLKNLYLGREYLTLMFPVTGGATGSGVLVIAADMNTDRQMLIFSLVLLAVILPISLILGLGMTNFVVRRSFVPLEEILIKMKRVEVSSLSEKIVISGNKNDELVRLAKSYNEMLKRINLGVKRQKEFVANASHELKTPLTQAVLELSGIGEDLAAGKVKGLVKKVETVVSDLLGLGRLIESMLVLSKFNETGTVKTKVKMWGVSQKVVAQYKAQMVRQRQKLTIEGGKDWEFWSVEDEVRIVLANLVSNAVKYGKRGSEIKIVIGAREKKGYLRVGNFGEAGVGFSARRLWRRFYRAEVKKEVGYGIGLSVVKEICKANKLAFQIRRGKNGWVEAEVFGFELVSG